MPSLSLNDVFKQGVSVSKNTDWPEVVADVALASAKVVGALTPIGLAVTILEFINFVARVAATGIMVTENTFDNWFKRLNTAFDSFIFNVGSLVPIIGFLATQIHTAASFFVLGALTALGPLILPLFSVVLFKTAVMNFREYLISSKTLQDEKNTLLEKRKVIEEKLKENNESYDKLGQKYIDAEYYEHREIPRIQQIIRDLRKKVVTNEEEEKNIKEKIDARLTQIDELKEEHKIIIEKLNDEGKSIKHDWLNLKEQLEHNGRKLLINSKKTEIVNNKLKFAIGCVVLTVLCVLGAACAVIPGAQIAIPFLVAAVGALAAGVFGYFHKSKIVKKEKEVAELEIEIEASEELPEPAEPPLLREEEPILPESKLESEDPMRPNPHP